MSASSPPPPRRRSTPPPDSRPDRSEPALERLFDRRRFIQTAVAGTTLAVLGAEYAISDRLTAWAKGEKLPEGRPRLPPGQRLLERLRPMGGEPGSPSRADFRLKVTGRVERPLELDFAALMKLPQALRRVDVHCVTGWSVFGARFEGVLLRELAARAGVKPGTRHVIFEAAHRYTSNVPLDEALADNVIVAHSLDGKPLARAHGAPVRAVIPDLYFWKSAKWLTGIRFVARDEPGYWEQRGYNNHGDPWREERYA